MGVISVLWKACDLALCSVHDWLCWSEECLIPLQQLDC